MFLGIETSAENEFAPEDATDDTAHSKSYDPDANTECESYEITRNQILRYALRDHPANHLFLSRCAAESEGCCHLLRDKFRASDRSSFRSCICLRSLVCDLEPFLDLEQTLRACGVVYKLPRC